MNARLTDEEIAELERLERKATAGPWLDTGRYVSGGDGGQIVVNDKHIDSVDQALIAAARNALPKLLAEVRELRARDERAKIVAWLRKYDGGIWYANAIKRGEHER